MNWNLEISVWCARARVRTNHQAIQFHTLQASLHKQQSILFIFIFRRNLLHSFFLAKPTDLLVGSAKPNTELLRKRICFGEIADARRCSYVKREGRKLRLHSKEFSSNSAPSVRSSLPPSDFYGQTISVSKSIQFEVAIDDVIVIDDINCNAKQDVKTSRTPSVNSRLELIAHFMTFSINYTIYCIYRYVHAHIRTTHGRQTNADGYRFIRCTRDLLKTKLCAQFRLSNLFRYGAYWSSPLASAHTS